MPNPKTETKPVEGDAPETAQELTKRVVRAISRDRIKLSRSARTEWLVTVPAGTEPEDLLNPDYWKHVAGELRFNAGDAHGRIGDDIIAVCEDRSWRACYEVRDVGPLHASLALLNPDSYGVIRYVSSVAELPLKTETHYVKWGGIGTLHTVRRTSDNEIIEKGFKTAQIAAKWMGAHCKKIAA